MKQVQEPAPVAAGAEIAMLYDGACPLCRREVAHYRRMDRAGRIEFRNIADPAFDGDACGIDRKTAMARLHVVDRAGGVHVGVPAFVEVWRRLPRYRVLPLVVRLPGVAWLLERGYDWFARRRLRLTGRVGRA